MQNVQWLTAKEVLEVNAAKLKWVKRGHFPYLVDRGSLSAIIGRVP
jgi:hypothetical protein